MNNTLVKGLGLLEVLARSERPMGVTELATRLGIGKSNVHRLLQALVELGYARRHAAEGTYAATIRLWEIGAAVLANPDLRRAGQAWMEWLLERTRETVHLSVLDGDEVVYVHKLDSPEPVRAYSSVGGRAPASCVATGKAMLAWAPQTALGALSMRLRPYTLRTLTEPGEFLRELERVRQHGFAVNRGEWRETVGGLAAPVRGPDGTVIAAVGISGPIERLRPATVKALSGDVLRAAHGIGSALAGAPGTLGHPGHPGHPGLEGPAGPGAPHGVSPVSTPIPRAGAPGVARGTAARSRPVVQASVNRRERSA